MYVHRTNNGKRISQYTCSQYTKVPCGTLCKTQHRINEDVVLSLVSEMLKAIAEYAKHDRAEFVRVVQEAQSSQQTAEVRKQRTRLATAKQRVSELEVLLCKIYEDNILGGFLKKNIRIKMPAGVPEGVTNAFSALIPAFVILTTCVSRAPRKM